MDGEQRVYALVMGRIVGTLRKREELSQVELARAVNVGQATISRIERGTLIPDAQLTGKLASVFDLSAAELLALVEDGVGRTQEAAEGALGDEVESDGEPWWVTAGKVAGVAGLAGLAIFAVAAALAGDDEEA